MAGLTIIPSSPFSSPAHLYTAVSAPSSGIDYLFYIEIDNSIIKAHEYNKNWQYKATYAEEGKKKEVISYFDGTLRSRQMVTKNNSDGHIIVGETYYDYNGRAAIQSMPVPLDDTKIKFYQYNVSGKLGFNFDNASGDPYTKEYFDEENATPPSTLCAASAGGMDNNYGAANYYSSVSSFSNQLAQGYVPDAEHFPFSQTVYTNDNTGRIAAQGGVGKAHQIGTDHETKYFYGSPEQVELDRLFGSEVGFKHHYKKNMVIDANGQVSYFLP